MSFQLNQKEGNLLVELARKAVEEYLKTRRIIKPPENLPEKFQERCGVFVTINEMGQEKNLLEDA